MSIAARICEHLAAGNATRPELNRLMKIDYKGLETALRKLMGLNMVRDTGERRKEAGPTPAVILALGPVAFNQIVFTGHEAKLESRKQSRVKHAIKSPVNLANLVAAMKPGAIYSANQAGALLSRTHAAALPILREGVERGHLEPVKHPTQRGAHFALIGTTGIKYGPSIATPLRPIQLTVPLTGDQIQKDRFRELCLLTRRD